MQYANIEVLCGKTGFRARLTVGMIYRQFNERYEVLGITQVRVTAVPDDLAPLALLLPAYTLTFRSLQTGRIYHVDNSQEFLGVAYGQDAETGQLVALPQALRSFSLKTVRGTFSNPLRQAG